MEEPVEEPAEEPVPVEEPVEEAPAAEGEEGAAMAEPEVIREKKATDEEEPADKKKK